MTRIRVEDRQLVPDGLRVILVVAYGGQESLIDLALPSPLFSQEPEAEMCRRAVHSLMTALEEWQAGNELLEVG